MSTNISKRKREDLIEKIKAIRTHIVKGGQDKNVNNLLSYLTELEKEIKDKKYGLIFEEHQETLDKTMRTHTPILIEEKDLFIDNGGKMNFLIEGDNLASLKLLQKTHKGKIDIIYIDPPYNTGNHDFVYDDSYVDAEDSYKHSKWLSFMKKRLEILKSLMNQKSYICISIDNNEQANLKLLCDSIFGEQNCIACIPRRTKSSGKTTNKLSVNHDYVLIYCSSFSHVSISGLDHVDKGFKNEDEFIDERGKFKLNQTLDYDSLQYSASLDYPLEIDGEIFYAGGSYEKYISRQSGSHQRADWAWRWSKDLVEFGLDNGFIVIKRKKNGTARIYTKTYLNASIKKIGKSYKIDIVSRTKPLSSLEFTDAQYSNDNAKKDLRKILDKFSFDYPKPVSLIDKLIRVCPNTNTIILDCFAGTGTTGHAVLKLNEDGGSRKFILCTNNQNNICRDVTYERIKRVIETEKYKASLKYYKIDFIPISERMYYEYADELLKHVRELVELENGINFIGNAKIAIILTDEELHDFITNIDNFKKCKKLYLGHDVLTTGEQEQLLKEKKIKINIIPDYYYKELEA